MLNLEFDSVADIIFWIVSTGVSVAAGVASYRRSRCLSRYPIWQAVGIGALAFTFTPIWATFWLFNRKAIEAEWQAYRAVHPKRTVPVG